MMEDVNEQAGATPSSGKKRIPKACSTCRHSKVRCDEIRPTCSRCKSLNKPCHYVEKPKTPHELKIQDLEQEIVRLNYYIQGQVQREGERNSISQQAAGEYAGQPRVLPIDSTPSGSNPSLGYPSPVRSFEPPYKRQRRHYRVKELAIPDFITEGVITEAIAEHYYSAFFSGCDRFVPIFDQSDTFNAIRSRGGLLFNAICAIGCSVLPDTVVESRTLNARLKRWLTAVILSPEAQSLETVQALMVMACYMPERSLILATALNIAVNIRLDSAFDLLVGQPSDMACTHETFALMRQARAWGHLLNLESLMQIDAGDSLDIKVKNVRRCRVLLDRPFSTCLDARLFSQVELNRLRSKINDTIATSTDLSQTVSDARVDIEIWYSDWKRVMTGSPLSGPELPSLIVNLSAQRWWAEGMAICRAIHATGINNIELMTGSQRELVSRAREALQMHQNYVFEDVYLKGLRYAMDFVWAKVTFSFLLLLKLSILLHMNDSDDLARKGRALQEALMAAVGYGSNKVYLRLLRLSVDAYIRRDRDGTMELEALVPDEFTNDWNFPGLELFSSPAGWDLLFDQYQLGEDLFVGLDV